MRQLFVYVPVEGSRAARMIDPGSGIVGSIREADHVSVYFEGNRHGYVNVITFADRCEIAAGRLWESYPTIARMVLPADELAVAGVFTERHGVDVRDGGELIALTRWLSLPATCRDAWSGEQIHREMRLSRFQPVRA